MASRGTQHRAALVLAALISAVAWAQQREDVAASAGPTVKLCCDQDAIPAGATPESIGMPATHAVALSAVPAPDAGTPPATGAPAAAPPAAPAQASAEPPPSPAALRFGKICAGCHTLGQGDRTGPDLLGVTQRRDKTWITQFIRAPGAAIDRGDPVASELFNKFKVRMPDQQISDQEVADLFAYLEDCTTKGGCKIVMGKIRPATEATPQEIALGQQIFEGTKPLAGGGPPCITCHNVRGVGILGGGTLAKDLTFAFARLGDTGISSALATTPFPLMGSVFGAARPLTDAEQFQVKAYLWNASRDGTPPPVDHTFTYLGVAGLFVTLGLIGMVWSGRMRGVRQKVLNRKRGRK